MDKGMMVMCKVREADGSIEHLGFSYSFIMSLQCMMTITKSLPLHTCKEVTKVVVLKLREFHYCRDLL